MSRSRFGLVGAGFWAKFQLAAWHELPEVECVAICDQDLERAQRLAASCGVGRTYTDAAKMIRTERPDFIEIVTGVSGHVPLVKLAAEMRVPVICQKPMAATIAECEDMVATCRIAGVPFAIHENWRWQAPLRRVKELLSDGVIGMPYRCRLDTISGFDVFANQPNLRTDERFIIADLGCHLFDLARCYFGEADSIYCRTSRVHTDIRGEDVATTVLTMNRGRTTVTVNLGFAGTPLEHECFPQTLAFIEGDAGSIEVFPDYWVRVTTQAGTHAVRVPPPRFAWADLDYAVVHSSMVPCHQHLLRALTTGRPAETDAAEYLRTMRLAAAAYDSASGGQVIRLEA
jgi:D-apiose dehydrogenase